MKDEVGLTFSRKDGYALAALLVLAAVLFGFRLGAVGFLDPDESFYALTAKEMIARNDFLTPRLFGSPQFEKPIFYYWVLIAFFKLGGLTEGMARLGSCLAGTLTVFLTYLWGRVLFQKREIAFLSALVLATSAQFIALSRIVLTDIFLCLFVTASFFCFSLGYADLRRRRTAWLFFFVFCALGFLTKGPLGVLLPFLGVVSYLAVSGELSLLRKAPWAWGIALFLAAGCSWYFYAASQHGAGFLRHFFLHENLRRFFVAEHKSFDRIWFYPAGLAMGFFPWSVFLPAAAGHAWKRVSAGRRGKNVPVLFLSLSFLPPFLFFMAAKSKLLSYPFPLFPIAALLLGAWLWKFYRWVRRGSRVPRVLLWGCFLAWGVFPACLAPLAYFYGRAKSLELFWPLAAMVVFSLPFFWAALFFLVRRKCGWALVSMVLAVVSFSCLVFGWLLPSADGAFSSKDAVSSYRRLDVRPRGKVFSTKLLFRGVSYYSGEQDIAVLIEDKRRAFYTFPALRLISSAEDFSEFASAGLPVYGFVREREFQYLERLAAGRWSLDVLEANAGKYIVKMDNLK